MKSLVEFLKEAKESSDSSKKFTINLSGLEGAEDLIKSLKDSDFDSVEIDDNKVVVDVNLDNDADKVYELLLDYFQKRQNDSKRSSDMSYAEKVRNGMDKLNDWSDFIDELNFPDDDDDDDDDKKEESKEDEKCPKCGKNPCECDKKEEE